MKVFETDTKPTADEAQAGIMRIHFGQNDIASCGCVTAGEGKAYECILDRMRIATKSFYRRRLGA